MLVLLQVFCALRVIGVIGVPAPVCNSSDQLDLLQTSSSEVAVHTKMKKVRTLDSETRYCSDVEKTWCQHVSIVCFALGSFHRKVTIRYQFGARLN